MSEQPTETRPDADSEPRSYAVQLSVRDVTIGCRADQYVLSAADAAGLSLPASCREGRCGTCRCKLLSGKVDMQHNGGIRERHIALGYILICCSRPMSDLVIEQ